MYFKVSEEQEQANLKISRRKEIKIRVTLMEWKLKNKASMKLRFFERIKD
jgi:hypothetical protein